MRASLLTAAALLALGCGGPSLGDLTTPTVVIDVSASASDPEVAALGDSQGGFGVSRAYLSMSTLTVMPCRADADEIVLSPRGYELISDPPNQELIGTNVTELCALRLDIDPLSENAAEGVPEDASVYIEATDDAGVARTLTGTRSWSILLEARDGESFGELPLLLGVDVSTWLVGVSMTEELGDFPLDAVPDDLEAAIALYADTNENGAIDGDEQTPVAQPVPAR